MKGAGLVAIITLTFIMFGCREKTAPKPIAYPYIDNSTTEYAAHDIETYPLQFEISNSATIERNDKNSGWLNIKYSQYNATIYCSYITTQSNNLQKDMDKSRELVYIHSKHTSKIESLCYNDTIKNLWAELYILNGNVATPLQFIATDNSSFIFRGSLYFNTQVSNDSVAPIVEYLKNDIFQIIETITPQ